MLQSLPSFQNNSDSKPIIYSISPYMKLFGTGIENSFHSYESKPSLDLRDTR